MKASNPASYSPRENGGTSSSFEQAPHARVGQYAFESVADLHAREARVAEDEEHEPRVVLRRADVPVGRCLHCPRLEVARGRQRVDIHDDLHARVIEQRARHRVCVIWRHHSDAIDKRLVWLRGRGRRRLAPGHEEHEREHDHHERQRGIANDARPSRIEHCRARRGSIRSRLRHGSRLGDGIVSVFVSGVEFPGHEPAACKTIPTARHTTFLYIASMPPDNFAHETWRQWQ